MIAVSHPTGNANVRALLRIFESSGDLNAFFTSLGFSDRTSRALIRRFFGRRLYPIPSSRIRNRPLRESMRMLAMKFAITALTTHETGWASVDGVYRDLDRSVARSLAGQPTSAAVIYAYEDGALETFRQAKLLGVRRVYDLPIAYCQTAQRLLREEAVRLPAWESTLGGTRDSDSKIERKIEELELAEMVVCPSKFVLDSLPIAAKRAKRCLVAEFGSPASVDEVTRVAVADRPLRVLFAGSMTQRKGLADLFVACRQFSPKQVELVVLGSPLVKMEFYRQQHPHFRHEPPRSHAAVLELMRSCDIFVLPSIVEGRALVQQEAMSCGLPLIVTANAGGEDLIESGQTGFLVPIRAPEAIAEKIAWFLQNRSLLPDMGQAARRKAASLTWESYGHKVLHGIRQLLAA